MYKNKEKSFHSIFNIATLNPENISKNINEINYVDLSSVSLGNINNVQKIKEEEGFPSRAKRKTEISDILYSTVRPNLKGHAIVKEENLTVSTGFAVLRPNLKDDSSFIFYNLLYNHEKIIKMCKGGNYPAINGKDLAEVLVLDVDSNERKNISKILDQQQGLIDSYKEKLSLLEEQEAYYQDELLSGRLRIRLTDESINYVTQQGWYLNNDLGEGKEKEFEEWIGVDFHSKIEFYKESEFCKYPAGDLFDFVQGVQVDLSEQKNEIEENYVRFLRIENYTKNSKDFRFVPKVKNESKYLLDDDIAMVRYGEPGFVCSGYDGLLANNLFKIVPKRKMNKKYLKLIFKSNNTQNWIKRQTQGGVMKSLNFKIMKELPIYLTKDYKDEFLISSFFLQIEHLKYSILEKIKVEEEKMDYLMDELLSGRIRVK